MNEKTQTLAARIDNGITWRSDLTAVAGAIEWHERQLDTFRERRTALVQNAVINGMPKGEIAELLGVAPSRITQLMKG